MNLQFYLADLPPMPRNRSHQIIRKGKGFMNVKTALCREYEKALEHELLKFEEDFMLFKTAFKPKLHYIKGTYIVFTPEELLFTKEGHISQRATDTDAHKVMQDTIFRCIGLDDKLNRDFNVITPPSHDGKWNFQINFSLRNIQCLKNTFSPISSLEASVNLL